MLRGEEGASCPEELSILVVQASVPLSSRLVESCPSLCGSLPQAKHPKEILGKDAGGNDDRAGEKHQLRPWSLVELTSAARRH